MAWAAVTFVPAVDYSAGNAPWSVVIGDLDAVKAFTVPANATIGPRILHAYGKFPDRTDPDRITIR